MHRRAFLAAAAGGVTAATAGCRGRVGGPVELHPGEPRIGRDGREKYVPYEHDGRVRAGVGLDQREVATAPTDPFGFRITVTHHGQGDDGERYPDSTVDRFRFDLRPEPNGGVFVTTTSISEWPVTLQRIDDGWRRITADLGDEGDSTLVVPTRIVPVGASVGTVALRLSVELSDGGVAGTAYQIEDTVRFDPVYESSDEAGG